MTHDEYLAAVAAGSSQAIGVLMAATKLAIDSGVEPHPENIYAKGLASLLKAEAIALQHAPPSGHILSRLFKSKERPHVSNITEPFIAQLTTVITTAKAAGVPADFIVAQLQLQILYLQPPAPAPAIKPELVK